MQLKNTMEVDEVLDIKTQEKTLFEYTKTSLLDRGVKLEELAKLVVKAQKKHTPNITLEDAKNHIMSVLNKREVQHAILTGIELDRLSEKKNIVRTIAKDY